jgi:two-component sensor histidine kinase
LGPWGSLLSRTAMMPGRDATSTQAPPLQVLRLAFRHTARFSLEAARRARAIFREKLQLWGLSDEDAYVACLVVTELITNVHKHACEEGDEIIVSVHRRDADGRYEIGVRDGSDKEPIIPAENYAATGSASGSICRTR